jgi:hypothetical protein
MFIVRALTKTAKLAIVTYCLTLMVPVVHAQQSNEIQLTYSNGQFQPSDLKAPADKPLALRVKNLDAKAMEFESKSLRVEKVVAAKSEGVINIRALKPGRYEFYDDFNEKARGALNVQ